MEKIISLFKRDYDGTRLIYDELVEGAEWVANGEGTATRKWDGTCCLVRDGRLYKRHDRKRDKRTAEYKPAPPDWEAAEPEPDPHTGHWPGWLPVGDGPEDRWHREAWQAAGETLPDGTYELIGPKVQGNPEQRKRHELIPHGAHPLPDAPRTFEALRDYLAKHPEIEGIVWHHPDGRKAKIKAKDYGHPRK